MPKPDVAEARGSSRRYLYPLLAGKLIPGHHTFKRNSNVCTGREE